MLFGFGLEFGMEFAMAFGFEFGFEFAMEFGLKFGIELNKVTKNVMYSYKMSHNLYRIDEGLKVLFFKLQSFN